MSQPQKIAVLGGGLGSLITALELTSGPNKGKYELTVYQNGWRLGGKGASGRNKAHYERIEEHGLHIWFGCYENAFRLFRGVLEEWNIPADHPWNPKGPKERWHYAFKTADYSAVVERWNNHPAEVRAAKASGLSGDPDHRGDWELWEFVLATRNNGEPGDGRPLYRTFPSLLAGISDGILGYAEKVDRDKAGTANDGTTEQPHTERWNDPSSGERGIWGLIWALLTLPFRLIKLLRSLRLGVTIARLLGPELFTDPDQSIRKLGILLNLGLSLGWGLLCNWYSIWQHTLDAIDKWEMREFLRKYGAREETVLSPILGSIYDAVFAQVHGDPSQENLAAGVGIRSMLRILLGYKHSMFYKMQAGMGDTIFTPIYQVLQARGVKFEYFHQVQNLELSADKKTVARIKVGKQVDMAKGPYQPLVLVNGLECWPSEPLWDQINPEQAAAIQKGGYDLEHANNGWADVEVFDLRARDSITPGEVVPPERIYDHVVLGISIGAFPGICGELMVQNPKFGAMVDKVSTVRTEAYQAWLKTDLAGLGWPGASPVFGNFIDPMNTWSDMTHLLPREEVPPEMGVLNIAYFCGPMPDDIPPDPASVDKHVHASAAAVLEAMADSFWPGTANLGGQFREDLVAMDYVRGNVNPSDRYVLSVAGATEFRLRPDESGFSNVTLTGDWVRNGWNAGCVEATVMAGMLASNAISGYPEKKDIAYAAGP
jgi:uncharacterized protein with NAD-binding domain and iron-sulfur cluster